MNSSDEVVQPPSEAALQAAAAATAAERAAAQLEADRLEAQLLAEQKERDARAAEEAAEANRISVERAAQAAREAEDAALAAAFAAREAELAAEIVDVGSSYGSRPMSLTTVVSSASAYTNDSMGVDDYEAIRAPEEEIRSPASSAAFASAQSAFSAPTISSVQTNFSAGERRKGPKPLPRRPIKRVIPLPPGWEAYVAARQAAAQGGEERDAKQRQRGAARLQREAQIAVEEAEAAAAAPPAVVRVIPQPPQRRAVPLVIPAQPFGDSSDEPEIVRVIPAPPKPKAPAAKPKSKAVKPKAKSAAKPKAKPKAKRNACSPIPPKTVAEFKLLMKKIGKWKAALKKEEGMLKRLKKTKGCKKAAAAKRVKVLERDVKKGKKELAGFKAKLNKLIKRFS